MPLKFAQEKPDRDRLRDPNLPKQPNVLLAAELPYRVNAIPPSARSAHFSKASSSTATPSASASNYNVPYRQRLVAAALGPTEDPHSSNDSSSAPSSNALSSSVTTSATSSGSSHGASKGKAKVLSSDALSTTATATRAAPPVIATTAAPVADAAEIDPNASYFERLMVHNANTLPVPGLSYFERRRAIWTTAPPIPPTPPSPSPSRVKLEALLSQPGAVESEEVWRAGLKNVWKGLVGGNQLRKRLPLAIVLKILQAGWLRDGTWPEGMVPPLWDQPIPVPPSTSSPQYDPSQAQHQRRAHEQEAYAAALQARASAEQNSGSAQMMHMQAYAIMGLQGGIPPGYSPSSGDAPEEGYYAMPYVYSETTPPPGENDTDQRMQGLEPAERREREDVPPLTPLKRGQEVESEMDTEDEMEEGDDSRTQGVVGTGDGRHEGG